ncbi:MAG TPA: rod shape-determining protein MreC, partial [Spirochaetales bacterium]|nr:rod shape-determining protein MreC [Spirochaetales bacterium]
SGSRDQSLVVQYIKKRAQSEIQFGDILVTSGLNSIYPPGIVVGRVTKVRSVEYLTSLEVEMDPVLDFGKLEYVFIVGEESLSEQDGL